MVMSQWLTTYLTGNSITYEFERVTSSSILGEVVFTQ